MKLKTRKKIIVEVRNLAEEEEVFLQESNAKRIAKICKKKLAAFLAITFVYN